MLGKEGIQHQEGPQQVGCKKVLIPEALIGILRIVAIAPLDPDKVSRELPIEEGKLRLGPYYGNVPEIP